MRQPRNLAIFAELAAQCAARPNATELAEDLTTVGLSLDDQITKQLDNAPTSVRTPCAHLKRRPSLDLYKESPNTSNVG